MTTLIRPRNRNRITPRTLVWMMALPIVWVPVIALGRGDEVGGERPAAMPTGFRVLFDSPLQSEPYTGRVYVMVSSRVDREPRRSQDWTKPPAVYAVDLTGADATQPVLIDGSAVAFPVPLAELPAGEYAIQAVARRSLDHPVPGQGPGDLYSQPVVRTLNGAEPAGVIELTLDKAVEARPATEHDRLKYVEIESRLLSEFHRRPMKLRAGVLLPAGWTAEGRESYPTLYMFTGFGGDHRHAAYQAALAGRAGAGKEADQTLIVVPDATCYYGHSVFVDSETNGPWGRALMEELIPHVEAKFRGAGSGERRFAAGVSSGGWAALWVQVRYPDAFNGAWAHCPDPVDFRDFQRINLYADGVNMYVDEKGERRPLMRSGEKVRIWYEDFIRMEDALGPGGQLRSFEACFSPRGADGKPKPLWDRATGRVDTAVARSWEPFDIRLVLERNWKTLAPKLRGKLHVFAGGRDDFYLEGAVVRLKESLESLGSDALVRIIPDQNHGLVYSEVAPMYRAIIERSSVTPPAEPVLEPVGAQ
jgi:S-formylglutathione hydrolase FrmB